MSDPALASARPLVVVTGGGGGIGAAVAEALGHDGWFVVTVDPLVSIDGTVPIPDIGETTAGRITAAGGAARASGISVTDGDAVRGLLTDLVEEFGRLDAVINVAGISRPTGFARGSEEDWQGVLSVHLDGYLNILRAALPIMAAAGRGRILGVTSGSGWRQADAGAYACAKRAVAALTWQLGREAPAGVTVNAMSPIAVTRMVTAALGAAAAKTGSGPGGSGSAGSATGGLSLGSMPTPEEIGPFGAHLVSEGLDWCSGSIFFAGGSEVAVIEQPRLIEVVRTDDVSSLAHALEAVTAGSLVPAETNQASAGGSNPRFGPIFDEQPDVDLTPAEIASCVIVSDRADVAARVTAAFAARGVACRRIPVDDLDGGFGSSADALTASVDQDGPIDAVVVALAGTPGATDATPGWERLLAEHDGLVDGIRTDAAWARSVADYAANQAANQAADTGRAIRLVTLTDAVTAGGRSRAQASAQLARSSRRATREQVAAFAVSVETTDVEPLGELAAHLVCSPDAIALSGAELVAGPGWVGLRSHPHPSGSVTFGGPEVPQWLDDTLRAIVGDTRGPDRTSELPHAEERR